jgi:hypothetical protein
LTLAANLPPAFAIAALCLATSGIITSQPIFWTFPTAYFGGIGAAVAIATINAFRNLGGFAAPTMKTWFEQGFGSSKMGLYLLAMAGLLAAVLIACLPRSHSGRTTPDGGASPGQDCNVIGTP